MSSKRSSLRDVLSEVTRRHASKPNSANERPVQDVPPIDLDNVLGPRNDARATRDWIERIASHHLGPDIDPGLITEIEEKNLTIAQMEEALLAHDNQKLFGPIVSRYDRSVGGRVGIPDNRRLIYIPAAKVVFCPIGKVANTAVKGWAIELSGRHVKSEDTIHRSIDQRDVPLQVQAWTRWRFDLICQDPEWVFVALVRDPALRMISAYWDKFVIHRASENTLQHTRPVLEYVYGTENLCKEDIEKGVSFRQFCQYLIASQHAVDSHWAPQYQYLQNFHWDRLFNIDRVQDFERFVRKRCPPEYRGISLGMRNAVPKRKGNKRNVEPLVDVLPNELVSLSEKRPALHAFLTPDIKRFISNYYALDYVLLDAAA